MAVDRKLSRLRPHLLRWALPVVCVAVAAALTLAVLRTIGPNPAIAYFYLFAIMVSAWWGGYIGGILALVLTFFGAPFLFIPKFTLSRVDPNRFVLTSLVALLISRVANARRQTEAVLRRANEELEQRVRERTAALERYNSALQRVAYIASHDLQEPLRAVCAFSQLLGDRYKDRIDRSGQECLHHVVAGAIRMQQLLADLLAFSANVHGTTEPRRQPVDVARALETARTALTLAAAESGATVTHDVADARVVADPSHLAQVFQNLLGNAMKYRSPERPLTIHVAAIRTGESVLITVTDNGIGLDMKYADRIFEAFKRLHGPETPGSGVGLAICRNIVESLGGRIWVDSAPGEGAAFSFTLPAAEPVEPVAAGQSAAASVRLKRD